MNHHQYIQCWNRAARLGLRLGLLGIVCAGCSADIEEPPPAEPRSFVGVDIDGSLSVDERGQFVFDQSARTFFDHFLAAEGEIPEIDLNARVRAEIDRRLLPDAADQAWTGYSNYLDYRREASALLEQDASPHMGAVGTAIFAAKLAEIRRRTVGDVPGIPDEGPRFGIAMQMQQVLNDPLIERSTRSQTIAALQTQLGQTPDPASPSRVLQRIHADLAPIALDDIEARHAVLLQHVGEAAAQRWLALEQQRTHTR